MERTDHRIKITHGSPKASTPEFETFTPIGNQEARNAKGEAENVIFKIYSQRCLKPIAMRGRTTSTETRWLRTWAVMIETYNEQVFKWERQANRDANVDDFVVYDDRKIKWSRDLKLDLKRGKIAEYSEHKLRNSLYRPFTKSNLFFDRIMNEEVYNFPSIFPTPETETRKSSDLCQRHTEVKESLHCFDDTAIYS